jgi:phage protein U
MASQNVMLALGDYRFSVDTAAYQSLQQSQSWGWVEQARVGSQPLLQLTGKALRSITMTGTIYPEYKGGFGQVSLMRKEADKGKPLTLLSMSETVDSSGLIVGDFVIMSVSETHRIFRGDGSPRAIEFSIELKQYIK